MRASPSRRSQLAWAAALIAGATAPVLVVLASGATVAWGDTAVLFEPLRPLVVEALRAGRLPLWNPHEALGIPLHAQLIHAALHPVSLVAAFLAPASGTDPLVVAHVALAALGAGVAARTLGCSSAAALVAGFGYGLSGYVLGMGSNLQYLGAAATAPWAVAALRHSARGSPEAVGLAALAVGVLHLAGDPQWTVVAVALGAALAVEAGGGPGLLRAAAGTALGTLVAMVQLAPSWVFLSEAARSGGLSPADRVQWAFSPWRLVELVAPGFFAGHASDNLSAPVFLWLGGPTQSRLLRPFVPSVFLGAALLALAVRGARSGRAGRWFAVAAAVALWLALGFNLGAQQALGWLPIWGSFRYAEKLVGPLSLCLALLAALGADRPGLPARAWAALGGVGAAAALVLLAVPLTAALFPAPSARTAEVARSALGLGLAHAGIGLLALFGAAHLARRGERPGPWWPASAAIVVLGASWAAAPFALHAGVPGVRETRPLAGIEAQPAPRIATLLVEPPFANPLGLGPSDLDVAARSRLADPPFNAPAGIDHVDAYTGLLPRRLVRLGERFGAEAPVLLRRFGLTHVVVKDTRDPEGMELARQAVAGGGRVVADEAWGFSVFAVPHRAWVRFARRVVNAATEAEALEALFSWDLSGMDATIVEGAAPPVAPGRVLSFSRWRGGLQVEAEADGPALLVVNDAFWPGWRAEVDGQQVEILRADYLVRAVPFPAGRHVLKMTYSPREASLGVGLTAIGLVAVLALLGAGVARPHRPRSDEETPAST